MKKQLVSCLLILSFVFSITSQTNEARVIDGFGRIPCGDFTARMDAIFFEMQKNPNSNVYVIYYGGRYRRIYSEWNQTTANYNKLKLEFAHREDGLNWAKAIPLYLTTEPKYSTTSNNLLKDRIILIDGGFQEETGVEIWLAPKDAKLLPLTPAIAEKDIKFRKDSPLKTPIFTDCYSGL